jgi:protein SCO1/2
MKKLLPIIILILILGFGLWYVLQQKPTLPTTQPLPTLESATVLNPSQAIAPFSLIDTQEEIFNNGSLQGHWTLLFFGYATCPAICPKTLSLISAAWEKLPKALVDGQTLKFAFVSLDPETDTPVVLRTFLDRFNPTFMGLTGDEAVIEAFSKNCGIYYWEDTTKTSAIKQIDHSATLLLFNPKGQLQALFTPPYASHALAKDLQTLVTMSSPR